MNWPDDYLIPGIEPFHQEEAGIIYCAKMEEVLPLLSKNSIDMIFTDPPYGHNNNNGDLIANWEKALGRGPAGEARPICNDGAEAEELYGLLMEQAPRLLKEEGCCCCCCCGGGGPDPMFARWSLKMDQHLTFKQMIVWDKGPMGMGWHYRRSYETVLVGHKGQKCKWYDETNRVENIIRPRHGIKKIIPSAQEHPTAKPPQLAAHFIKLHSLPGEVVLDPFMGGGSTIEAARKVGRKYIGIEMEEAWCKLAVKRLRQGVLNFG